MEEDMITSFITEEFTNFLLTNEEERLEEILRHPDDEAHFGVEVDVDLLQHFSKQIAHELLLRPSKVILDVQDAINCAQEFICENIAREEGSGTTTIKKKCHARFFNLPQSSANNKRNLSVLRGADVNSLISVNVTVVRVGSVMIHEIQKVYECARCGYKFDVMADIASPGCFLLPVVCPSLPSEGSRKRCSSSSFRQVDSTLGECHDYQELKAQEKIGSTEVGSMPGSIVVVVGSDLVGSCKPGDDAIITGILRRRQKNRNSTNGTRCHLEMFLEATSVRLRNEEKATLTIPEGFEDDTARFWKEYADRPLDGRNVIIGSICPGIYGLHMVKLILAMTLIGGAPRDDSCGTRVRGESHLLIVGDPGTGKSQLLRYAASLSPRSVMTTGIGTSSAGLTVSAVRDQMTGEWTLDAGALVLADDGLCCIDEFSSIRQQDRVAIHEAMEQQTVSVAKAGLVCTLDTRTTVFAVTNPSAGKMSTNVTVRSDDVDESDAVYLNLSTPLLSRFDVVLTLMDPKDSGESWHEKLSSFILDGRRSTMESKPDKGKAQWSTHQLKTYFHYVQKNIAPELSSGAEMLLGAYYRAERAAERRNAARTTVRLLESLIRLTQAHARLMCRKIAVVQDSVFAIAAVESSAVHPSVLGAGQEEGLQALAPEDPEREYRRFSEYILVKLGLDQELDPLEGCGAQATTTQTPDAGSLATDQHGGDFEEEMRSCSPTGRAASPSGAGVKTASDMDKCFEDPEGSTLPGGEEGTDGAASKKPGSRNNINGQHPARSPSDDLRVWPAGPPHVPENEAPGSERQGSQATLSTAKQTREADTGAQGARGGIPLTQEPSKRAADSGRKGSESDDRVLGDQNLQDNRTESKYRRETDANSTRALDEMPSTHEPSAGNVDRHRKAAPGRKQKKRARGVDVLMSFARVPRQQCGASRCEPHNDDLAQGPGSRNDQQINQTAPDDQAETENIPPNGPHNKRDSGAAAHNIAPTDAPATSTARQKKQAIGDDPWHVLSTQGDELAEDLWDI